jgi:hypothetical protein
MHNLTDSDIAGLTEIVLLANTPGYVLSRMRNHPVVKSLAVGYPSDCLIRSIEDIDQSPNLTVQQLTIAYACLVALTFTDRSQNFHEPHMISMDNIKWARRISKIWHSQFYPTTTQNAIQSIVATNRPRTSATNSISSVETILIVNPSYSKRRNS